MSIPGREAMVARSDARSAVATCLRAVLLLPVMLAGATHAADPGHGESASGGNRVVVGGNSARNVAVHCDAQGARRSVRVNSVDVSADALRGRTVVVTGRNTHDVRVQDCPPAPSGGNAGVQVNSVTIR